MSVQLQEWITRLCDPNCYPFKGMSADESPLEEDAVVVDPTNDFDEVSDDYENEEEEEEDLSFVYRGKKDERGYFHGGGTVTFGNGDILMCDFDHGVRFGEAVVVSPRNNISRLVGTYVGGRLQGKGKVISTDTSVTECFFKDGVIHGPVRRTDMKKFREFRQQLAFVGRFRSGRPSGPCWTYKEGGGYLFCVENEKDNPNSPLSGDDVAYLYPDLSNAWLGSFQCGRMTGARRTRVRGTTKRDDDFVLAPLFETPSGESVSYSKSSRSSMGENLLVPDPYESDHVLCSESKSGCGQGLFALHDIPTPGAVVSFYNGVRIPFLFGGPKEDWDTSAYKIFVNADFVSGERMDIPAEFTDLGRYRATLGHKMNHSFLPNCAEWFFDHPRFGVVPCQRTIKAVDEGEELLMDYDYDPYNCPEWFRNALVEFVATAEEGEMEALNGKYARFVETECDRKS